MISFLPFRMDLIIVSQDLCLKRLEEENLIQKNVTIPYRLPGVIYTEELHSILTREEI
jgi:hypothetical protein